MATTKDEKTKIRKRTQQMAALLGLDYTELLITLQARFIEEKTDEVFEKLQEKTGEINGKK